MAENFSMPAGYIKENEKQYSVKVGEQFSKLDEIENLLCTFKKMYENGLDKLLFK